MEHFAPGYGDCIMPKFLFTSGIHVPLDRECMDFTDGIFAAPSGVNVPDVETRSINGENTVMSGEMIFIPSSGVLMVASGESWRGIEF